MNEEKLEIEMDNITKQAMTELNNGILNAIQNKDFNKIKLIVDSYKHFVDHHNNLSNIIFTGDLELVKLYFTNYKDQFDTSSDEMIALAARDNHLDIVKYLYAMGWFFSNEDKYHLSNRPLNWAITNNHLDVVKYLISIGSVPDCRALTIAAGHGLLEMTKYLIEEIGLNPEGDGSLNIPSNLAYQNGYIKVSKYIESKIEGSVINMNEEKINFAEYDKYKQLEKLTNIDHPKTPILDGIYRHFKGDYYKVMGVCKFTETGELMVVYRSINKVDENGNTYGWVRPLDMFMSKVDKEKYPNVTQEYRFEHCFGVDDVI